MPNEQEVVDREAVDNWRLALAFWCGSVWEEEVLASGWGRGDLSRDQRAFVHHSQDIAQLAEEVMLLDAIGSTDRRDAPYAAIEAWFAGPQALMAGVVPNALRDAKVQHLATKMNRYHSGPRACGHLELRTMHALLRSILGAYAPGVLCEETVAKVREQIDMLKDTLVYYERPKRSIFRRLVGRRT